MRSAEGVVQSSIVKLVERIEIRAQSASEEIGAACVRSRRSVDALLRQDGDRSTDIVQSELTDVDAVDENPTARRLDETEQRRQDRALAGSCATTLSSQPKSY